MQSKRALSIMLMAMAMLAACSSAPKKNARLEEARSNYQTASSDPQVVNFAALELKEAGQALNTADEAWKKKLDNSKIEHLAYMAQQKVTLAQTTAKQKEAEIAVSNANSESNKIRLEARTNEADKAVQSAEVAKQEAQAAQQNAKESQLMAEASKQDVAASQQQMQIAQQEAQTAQQKVKEAEERASQFETQMKELNAKNTDRGLVITLGDVLFDSGKAQLKSGATRNLQKLTDVLKQYPQRKILVEGFTDSKGSDEYNQQLSEQRANAVRAALINMEVSADRITTRGYGKNFPVAGNDSAASRQANRRVEIIISDDNGSIAKR
ncbi:MAG: OmpA family protein [Gallionellaceae bacterium]|nr:OmpA family protein [Gallionellaceae bacterium]